MDKKRIFQEIPIPPRRMPLFEMMPAEGGMNGEQKLCSRMIVMACIDLLQPRKRQIWFDAWTWVFKGQQQWPYLSFADCCSYLGLDQRVASRGIKRLAYVKSAAERRRYRNALSNVVNT